MNICEEQWMRDHPVSELVNEIEHRACLLQEHARLLASNMDLERDPERYTALNALAVNIKDMIRRFSQETTRRIERD